jgi:hypothetical protein
MSWKCLTSTRRIEKPVGKPPGPFGQNSRLLLSSGWVICRFGRSNVRHKLLFLGLGAFESEMLIGYTRVSKVDCSPVTIPLQALVRKGEGQRLRGGSLKPACPGAADLAVGPAMPILATPPTIGANAARGSGSGNNQPSSTLSATPGILTPWAGRPFRFRSHARP